jgi:hypothetical protein
MRSDFFFGTRLSLPESFRSDEVFRENRTDPAKAGNKKMMFFDQLE